MFRSFQWVAPLSLAALLLVSETGFAQRTRVVGGGFPVFPGTRTPQLAPPRVTIGTPSFPNLYGRPIDPSPFIAPGLTLGQAAYNTAVLGRALSNVPPYAYGYNPYITTAVGGGPALMPYSLSTVAGNPYLGGGGATLSTSPYGGDGYSLSTSPGYGGYGYGGYPYGSYIPPFAAALQGYASLTAATGQYWKDIGQAQITREAARQARFDTMRKQIELERWIDENRLTGPKMVERERMTDLDRARKDPPLTEIWSAKSLNDLLRSIKSSPKTSVPNLPVLDEDTVKHINLSDGSSRGNVGLLKDNGKLTWPLSLQEPQFDKTRKRFSRNIQLAVGQLKDKEPVEAATLKDINADFKALNTTLNDSADDMSPAQYIEAKRYLNQLSAAVRALSDPKAAKYFDNTWVAKAGNIAGLVDFMIKEGLVFAPAAPGDEASYNALYQAIRSYEARLQSSGK